MKGLICLFRGHLPIDRRYEVVRYKFPSGQSLAATICHRCGQVFYIDVSRSELPPGAVPQEEQLENMAIDIATRASARVIDGLSESVDMTVREVLAEKKRSHQPKRGKRKSAAVARGDL